MPRTASITRKTNETDIVLDLNLDPGQGSQSQRREDRPPATSGIRTDGGFLDHMLDHVARHGRIDLAIHARGDTHIDDHHTVEDVGIVLGQALEQALGDKRGIERFGHAVVPMDEALARVTLDLSDRPALVYHVEFRGQARVGRFDVQLVREFFQALANNARCNLHIEAPWGENNHHIAEAIFKAFGRALRQAVAVTGEEVPSTKGVL